MNNFSLKDSNGKHYVPNTGKYEIIYCPCNGWDCFYYKEGVCYVHNPIEDCNDFRRFWRNWKEWEDT